MKASLTLRDGKEPLLRTKLSFALLGLPLSSGLVVAASGDELCVHVGIHNALGFSSRVNYKPNESNPFSLIFKLAFGQWDSAAGSPFLLGAELGLSRRGPASLILSLKPSFGDFGLRKSTNAMPIPAVLHSARAFVNITERTKALFSPKLREAVSNQGFDDKPKPMEMSLEKEEAKFEEPKKEEHFSPGHKEQICVKNAVAERKDAWKLIVHSSLPLGKRMVAGIRWRMEIAAPVSGSNFLPSWKLPVLSFDKFSLERSEFSRLHGKKLAVESEDISLGASEENKELSEVAVLCTSMRQRLHFLYVENQVMRKTMEDMGMAMGWDTTYPVNGAQTKALLEWSLVKITQGFLNDDEKESDPSSWHY